MTKYREILRLKSLELSQQRIADSCKVSKKTVNRVLKRAEELGVSWPLDLRCYRTRIFNVIGKYDLHMIRT